MWLALLIVGGAAAPRPVFAEAGSLPLEDEWFVSLVRAESLVTAASVCGEVDSIDRAAVAEQIRVGVHVLGTFIVASIAVDTLLTTPFAMERPPAARRRWTSRILSTTGVISAAASLAQLFGTLGGAAPETRRLIAYIGGSAAGVSGVIHARTPSRPEIDTIERSHTLDLESDLRASVDETEHAVERLWGDLRGMALDSCATEEQVVRLARRYANAIQQTSVILDSRVARSRSLARSCAEWRGFAVESRERSGALASHWDALEAQWQELRWLIERSNRNTFAYLVIDDRP